MSPRGTLTVAMVVACYFVTPPAARCDLLLNPSFETVPNSTVGQGLLPSDYSTSSGPFLVGADTYSNDGSYGLFPSDFGNFPGVVAQDGIRFVAGGDFSGVRETFGQQLAATLTPNASYTISAFLRESPRFAIHGGYEILLSPSISFFDSGVVSVGQLGATTGTSSWEARELTFVAPINANALPFMILAPYSVNADVAYIGIDNLSLTVVPEASSCLLASIGAAAACGAFWRRRSHKS